MLRQLSAREAYVGAVHCSAFGVENHVRIAYAVPMPTLRDACRRIETACAALVLAVTAV
ncbi:aspartate aminotransferase [Caballeronia cordobensis]|uniref:Aspartate aminotransferase n=1 Tax=Caballeronia cordobensis TaxID=1353886 RepID=A0A158HPI0_CABCO|nr:aspartate aminotransferase [Caballeronia cordobensis]